jgi:RimJ/RimL family protein N-acetyltransferase
MERDLGIARLRKLTLADAVSLARHANDRAIWKNLRDAFPSPYSVADAEQYLLRTEASGALIRGLEVDGEAVGAIGVHPRTDVYRHGAELGYWLGRAFHGRGIVTRAVAAMVELAFEQPQLERLEAGVFGWNLASMRVLEKNGFALEAVMRRAVFKDGQTTDQHLYVRLKG